MSAGWLYRAVGGDTEFFDSSSAGNAVLTTDGGSSNGGIGSGGGVFFYDGSTADHCTIIANGGNGRNAYGGGVLFQGTSTAGNATLIANGGINGGKGASIGLKTDGGLARIEVFGNGLLDTGGLLPAVAVGSIEGDGIVDPGTGNTLIVGTNDLTTTFAGTIRKGALNKTGQGTLILSNGNSGYKGGTTVSAGALQVSNSSGSATGIGPVGVSAGTLQGGGIITGPLSVGTGDGTAAFLAPGQGANTPVTLTVLNFLTFESDGVYTCKLSTQKAKADQVIANGVMIENGAQCNIVALGKKRLASGFAFTILSNTSATPISGTFANLPDGSTLTAGRNTLSVSYTGGDGNDLTLTVQ